MIPTIPGWTFEASEREVLLRPLDELSAGAIRYRERVRPLAGLATLLEGRAAEGPGRATRVGAPAGLVTAEGEYAAIATIDRELDGAALCELAGFVLMDDFYSETIAVVRAPGQLARFERTVRDLVHADEHMLGPRRRACPHVGPSGWRRAARGSRFHTVWRPAEKEDPTELVVAPARPRDGGVPVERLVAQHTAPGSGLVLAQRSGPSPVATRHGLSGDLFELRVTRLGAAGWARFVAVLQDAAYVYNLHLDSPPERVPENRAHFLSAVRSVCPLPQGRARDTAAVAGHWVTP